MFALNAKAVSMFLAGIVACLVFNQRLYETQHDGTKKKSTESNRFSSLSSMFLSGSIVAEAHSADEPNASENLEGSVNSFNGDVNLISMARTNAIVIGVAGGSGSGNIICRVSNAPFHN